MPANEESHNGRTGSGDFLALHDAHSSAVPTTGSPEVYSHNQHHNHSHGGRSGAPGGAVVVGGGEEDVPTPLEIPPTPTTSTRQALAVPRVMRRILTVLFLHVFAIMMMVPVITELALQRVFDGDEGTTAVFLTVVNLVGSLAEFVSNPLVGAWSDAVGRKRLMAASMVAMAVVLALTGLLPSQPTFVFSAILRGVTATTVSLGYAMIVDVSGVGSHNTTVTVNLGLLLAAAALGLLLGPVVGGILATIDLMVPFVTGACVEIVAAGLTLCIVPETLHTVRPFSWAVVSPFRLLHELFKQRELRLLLTLHILVMFAFSMISQAAVWSKLRFGWQPLDLGAFLAFVGLLVIVVQGVVGRLVIPRLGEDGPLMVGLVSAAMLFAAMGLSWVGWHWYVIVACCCASFMVPTLVRGLITKQAPPQVQGRLQGCISSLQTLTSGIGPVVGSGLFVLGTQSVHDSHASVGDIDLGAAIPFGFAAGLFLIAIVLARKVLALNLGVVSSDAPFTHESTVLSGGDSQSEFETTALDVELVNISEPANHQQ